jgi:hypothetical protein
MLIMLITRKQPVNPTLLQRLPADLSFRLTNAPGQNNLGDRGMDHRSVENYRRRLVDGGVGFIIGGLGKVYLRDGGDEYHRDHQGHYEEKECDGSRPHKCLLEQER